MGRASERDPGLDAYVFPTVIGGGLGDVAEVRDAGVRLHRAGFNVRLYRARDRPMPTAVGRLFEGSPIRALADPDPDHPRALIVAPMWGVSAAPARDEPFGRPGAWDPERRRLESVYGPGNLLHVSLEEFARTLTSREETIERYREGGRPIAEIRRHLATSRGRQEVGEFHDAYRKFRAFDRPDILHLFATFGPSARFAREYPEAIQTGPLWPPRAPRPVPSRSRRARSWVWYASPSTSDRIAPEVERGLVGASPPVQLTIRGRSRDGSTPIRGFPVKEPLGRTTWDREFASAELRIVTGSRTLLEALSDGRPFLYYNGTVGSGRSQRRHRPEKIRSLIVAWRSEGIRRSLWAPLDDFSKGRRVREIVENAAAASRFRAAYFPPWRPRGFAPPFDEAGDLLVRVAKEWAEGGVAVDDLVTRYRSMARQRIGSGRSRPPPAIRV